MITDDDYYPALLRSYKPTPYGYMVCEACDVVCVGYPNEVKFGCAVGRNAKWMFHVGEGDDGEGDDSDVA